MEDRDEPARLEIAFADQEGAQLCVAVLLAHENRLVAGNEIEHVVVEREGADAHRVDMDAAVFERLERLRHRRGGRAEIQCTKSGRLARRALDGPRHQPFSGLEFMQQALHVVDIVRALFGIAGVTVLAGATRKEGAARGVGPRKGTKRDAVAVDVEIAAELYASSELLD